jgi:hypothetical protein
MNEDLIFYVEFSCPVTSLILGHFVKSFTFFVNQDGLETSLQMPIIEARPSHCQQNITISINTDNGYDSSVFVRISEDKHYLVF